MKNNLFYATLILLISFFAIHSVKADQVIRMKTKENKVACTGVGPMECMVVKYKGSKGWTFFYSEIEGFQYEAGYRYTLLVNRKTRENVPADASKYAYELVRVVKKRQKDIARKVQSKDSLAIDFLAKYKWKLIQMNGKIQENSSVHMIFDKKNGQISGFSGCNRFFGPYLLHGEQIRFDKIAGTLMVCAPAFNQIEADFLDILKSDDLHFDIAEQTFNIYKGNELLLMFGLSAL